MHSESEDRFGTTTDWGHEQIHLVRQHQGLRQPDVAFRETDLGVFCAHHYRYHPDRSTFLVEVEAATWQRAGFESSRPDETIRCCERVFAKDLDGHRIISNNSQWRNFPVIWNERWSFENVVLLGDALRTAHF